MIDNKFYTYILSNSEMPDIPFYVGKGCGRRMYIHLIKAKKHKHYNIHLQNTILKLLRENKSIVYKKIIEDVSDSVATNKEIELIVYYKSIGIILCNMTDGGDGPAGRIAWNKGISPSKETIKKISDNSKGRIPWNYKKHWDDNVKLKIQKKLQDRKLTEEHKENIRKNWNPKKSDYIPWNKGKKYGKYKKQNII